MLPRFLQPTPTITDAELSRSLTLMKWEGVLSGAMFALASGGFMAGYALALGANNLQIGVIASLPFVTQILQIPFVVLVERFRVRKAFNVIFWALAQLMWIPIALVPFLVDVPGRLAVSLVILLLAIRGVFAPMVSVAWNSWMRDLVPQSVLGTYYANRFAWMTGVTAIVSVGAGYLIDLWQRTASPEADVYGFSFVFIAGALFMGLPAAALLVWCSEPQMRPAAATGQSTLSALFEPWHDHNFKHLIRFLFLWGFSSNLAIPFFAVYMLTRLDMSLSSVVILTAVSQIANVWFVGVWGSLADRTGNKTVLSLSASLYLLVIIGWTFTTFPERHAFTVPLLVVLHIFAGFAAGGATVTAGTIALKTAPAEKATTYIALATVATFLGQGLGPLVGGSFADYFSERSFTISGAWISPNGEVELPALALQGFDFLFAVAFVLGLLSLNLLIALKEEGELSRDVALRELSQASAPALAKMTSSVPGLSIMAMGPLRKIPGLDVALGVTAYQVAASTAAAVRAATQGHILVRRVASEVTRAVAELAGQLTDGPDRGREVARHSLRGAVVETESARVAHGAVVGTLHSLSSTAASAEAVLEGVGYGAVEGALEGHADPGEVALAVVAGARQAAGELGVNAETAAGIAAQGVMEAAAAAGPEALEAVRDALPDLIVERAEEAIASHAEAEADLTRGKPAG